MILIMILGLCRYPIDRGKRLSPHNVTLKRVTILQLVDVLLKRQQEDHMSR